VCHSLCADSSNLGLRGTSNVNHLDISNPSRWLHDEYMFGVDSVRLFLTPNVTDDHFPHNYIHVVQRLKRCHNVVNTILVKLVGANVNYLYY